MTLSAGGGKTPLKFLGPGWFSMVMGLCGLTLAWSRAQWLLGAASEGAVLALGALAALVAVALGAASLMRARRHPEAWAEDLRHPMRHAFVATMPASVILLATVLTLVAGPNDLARALWMVGALWQFAVTVWVMGRWLRASPAAQAPGGKPGPGFWAGVTPVLVIPVVGNVLTPLAGVPLGFGAWSAAQFGVGLFFWPVILVLLILRIVNQGLWPERLLPATFITVAPPAVIGSGFLQQGAPPAVAWAMWGVAVFFLAWSALLVRRMLAQPFSVPFWALSFPLAAFAALTLRLAEGLGSGLFNTLAVLALAFASLVIAALLLATFKGLRDGTLLVPEPVASIVPAQGP
ncbi:MAG TPA: SLAC1 anion channel family protein [Burkholderiaceae bacterium]|nr:SLAC1 anion channel family protein [Burkholderiaceae bacterium]